MVTDLSHAKAALMEGNCTCVLCKGELFFQSRQRGVKPVLEFLDSGKDFRGFCAADKVVGKATAFLYCLLGVKAVYAPVISRAAAQVLTENGIDVRYDTLADGILNHKKDGFCPMETAVKDISAPEEALPVIRQTLRQLQAGTP